MTNDEILEILLTNNDNALINQYAGGGKSTLCRNLLKKRESDKNYYITFSKTMADEFKHQLGNTKCNTSTIHSLAFRGLLKMGWNPAKLQMQDFPINYTNFNKKFGLNKKDFSYNIIKEHYQTFLNKEAKAFIYVDNIEDNNLKQIFLDLVSEVDKQVLPCSHSFYLKKYALQYTPLDANTLLIDEAQDCSPLTYTIIRNQTCRVIGVGDTFQNIYSELMKTVNLFDLVDWKTYYSGNSYRVNPETAVIANKVLSVLDAPVELIGLNTGVNTKSDINCTLFTSNYEMLKTLYKGDKAHVIIGNERLDENLNFVEDCMKFIAKEQGGNWKLNKALKDGKTVKDMINYYLIIEEPNKALILTDVTKQRFRNFKNVVLSKMINKPSKEINTYCTIHQSKGLTFNNVFLEWNEDIIKWFDDPEKHRTSLNLLYVAITRASGKFNSDKMFFDYLKC